MKISLVAAAALSIAVACTPPSAPQDTEAQVTKKLGLSGGECLQCAQDALEGACGAALDECAADLEACLDGSAIEDVAMCIVGECGAACMDAGAGGGGGPSTDPIDDGSGAGGSGSGSTTSGDPGDIPGGLGGGGNDGGGGGDTCPPDDDCGCDDDCDLDAVCDDLLACGEECWFSTDDDDEFIDCLINECGATEDLADECDL